MFADVWQRFYEAVGLFSNAQKAKMKDAFGDIFTNAVNLDLAMSRSTMAKLTFRFPEALVDDTFENRKQYLAEEETMDTARGQNIRMVVAPALYKLGTDTGMGYDEEEKELMKPTVSCAEPAGGKRVVRGKAKTTLPASKKPQKSSQSSPAGSLFDLTSPTVAAGTGSSPGMGVGPGPKKSAQPSQSSASSGRRKDPAVLYGGTSTGSGRKETGKIPRPDRPPGSPAGLPESPERPPASPDTVPYSCTTDKRIPWSPAVWSPLPFVWNSDDGLGSLVDFLTKDTPPFPRRPKPAPLAPSRPTSSPNVSGSSIPSLGSGTGSSFLGGRRRMPDDFRSANSSPLPSSRQAVAPSLPPRQAAQPLHGPYSAAPEGLQHHLPGAQPWASRQVQRKARRAAAPVDRQPDRAGEKSPSAVPASQLAACSQARAAADSYQSGNLFAHILPRGDVSPRRFTHPCGRPAPPRALPNGIFIGGGDGPRPPPGQPVAPGPGTGGGRRVRWPPKAEGFVGVLYMFMLFDWACGFVAARCSWLFHGWVLAYLNYKYIGEFSTRFSIIDRLFDFIYLDT